MNSVWITDEDGIERLVNVGSDAHKEYELQEQITQKINQKISNNLTNKQMKKAKITNIQGNGTWSDLFKFDVTMDNNDTGTVFSKSQTPSFAVGDEKSYEITPSGRGHKIKWIQEQRSFTPSSNGGSSYQKSPQDKVEIARALS